MGNCTRSAFLCGGWILYSWVWLCWPQQAPSIIHPPAEVSRDRIHLISLERSALYMAVSRAVRQTPFVVRRVNVFWHSVRTILDFCLKMWTDVVGGQSVANNEFRFGYLHPKSADMCPQTFHLLHLAPDQILVDQHLVLTAHVIVTMTFWVLAS